MSVAAAAPVPHKEPVTSRAAASELPKLQPRLMPTHVNYMVAGGSGLGKTSFIQRFHDIYPAERLHGGLSPQQDAWEEFLKEPGQWLYKLQLLSVPEACRTMIITLQVCPEGLLFITQLLDPSCCWCLLQQFCTSHPVVSFAIMSYRNY